MCYTLNNGSCLRSGQAVASRAPARQGGCAAGFFHSLRKRKTWVEERPCERDGLTAKRNKARRALMLPAWPPRKPEPSCSSARHRLWQTGAQPGQAHGLHFSSGCRESTGPALSTALWGHFPPRAGETWWNGAEQHRHHGPPDMGLPLCVSSCRARAWPIKPSGKNTPALKVWHCHQPTALADCTGSSYSCWLYLNMAVMLAYILGMGVFAFKMYFLLITTTY